MKLLFYVTFLCFFCTASAFWDRPEILGYPGCDLKKAPIPQVYLFGEGHGNKASMKSKKILLEFARDNNYPIFSELKGKYFITAEETKFITGVSFPSDRSDKLYQNGIDHEGLWWASTIYRLRIGKSGMTPEEVLETAKRNFPFFLAKHPDIARKIGLEGTSDQIFHKAKSKFATMSADSFWKNFDRLSTMYIAKINRSYRNLYGGKNLVFPSSDLNSNIDQYFRLSAARDKVMAFEIAKGLCSYSGLVNKIPVLTGLAHSCGIRKILKESYSVPESKIGIPKSTYFSETEPLSEDDLECAVKQTSSSEVESILKTLKKLNPKKLDDKMHIPGREGPKTR